MSALRATMACLWFATVSVAGPAAALHPDIQQQAIELSQAALGNRISDMAFVDSRGQSHRLSEFEGRPVAISLVFTACVHACSVTTRHIDRVAQIARAALGAESFTLLTIGFDTPVDTPEALRAYANRHGISDPNWHFLASDDAEAMARLMEELGFVSVASPRGFDHTVQLSLLDRDGILYRQVYGELFNTPLLVEPLKDLVLGRPASDDGLFTRVSNRVRLFCTVYDPKSGRYYFDYSLFAGMFIGVVFIGGVALWLLLEVRGARRRRTA
ncbi:MAG TPA: SCO family protein [Xanthomonadaceae bacterium]|nr:SCO family protein [Xanthomonadaceae bacterium]